MLYLIGCNFRQIGFPTGKSFYIQSMESEGTKTERSIEALCPAEGAERHRGLQSQRHRAGEQGDAL